MVMPTKHCHLVLLAMLALTDMSHAQPASRPTTSKLWKTIHDTVLHDAKRDKDLRVTIRIPDAPGPHPLIVFSHGAGGAGENYALLADSWARKHYVVIQPTHGDSISLMDGEERRKLRPRDVVIDAVTDVKGWEERARDVTFVLDSLDDLERVAPALKGKIDRERIGVGGHSYGAMTTAIVAGAKIRTKVGGELQSLADPRVKAAVVMSGQGEGQMGFTEGSWDEVKVPMMVMTGSEDRGAKGQDPMWRKAPFEHSPAGGKYWVFIHGATHMSFSGRDVMLADLGKGGERKAIFAVITRTTAAFWDAHLRGDANARKRLESGEAVKDERVKVDFEQR